MSIVPPYDAANCMQLAPNAKLFDRIQKVVRHLTCLGTETFLHAAECIVYATLHEMTVSPSWILVLQLSNERSKLGLA